MDEHPWRSVIRPSATPTRRSRLITVPSALIGPVSGADGLNQRGLLAHKPPSDAAKQNSIKPAPVSFRFVWYSGSVG
jgi:hypothetical protein